jgi:hypothetical protein
VFSRLRDDPFAAEYDVARSLKKVLLLHDWIEEVRTKDLERTYRVWAGTIGRIGEEFSWLADGLAAITSAVGWTESHRRQVGAIADRLVHGIRADAVGLAPVRVRGLGRVYLRRLVDAGLASEEALKCQSPDELRKVIGNRRVATSLWESLHEPKEDRPYSVAGDAPEISQTRAAEPSVVYEPPLLRIDLVQHRLHYRDFEIPTKPPGNLQPQLFRALAVLALHPGEPIGMARMAEEMFKLGGISRKPVAPEQRDLRYRIVRTLRGALTPHGVKAAEVEALVENLAGVGLRLVTPGRIEVTGSRPIQQSIRA